MRQYLENCTTSSKLLSLLMTNRKLCARFRLVSGSVTLDDLELQSQFYVISQRDFGGLNG